eukprot:m.932327 g.932327  ORF g.932327 m.932327 type:complete len:129 (+) comp23789_c0_seq3:49-435(+)
MYSAMDRGAKENAYVRRADRRPPRRTTTGRDGGTLAPVVGCAVEIFLSEAGFDLLPAPLTELRGDEDAPAGGRDVAVSARRLAALRTTGEDVLLDAADVSVTDDTEDTATVSTRLFCGELGSSMELSE